jgi:hypothetical protein
VWVVCCIVKQHENKIKIKRNRQHSNQKEIEIDNMACGLHAASSNDGRRNKNEIKNIGGGKEGANWTRQHVGFMLPCHHHHSYSPLPPSIPPLQPSSALPSHHASCLLGLLVMMWQVERW